MAKNVMIIIWSIDRKKGKIKILAVCSESKLFFSLIYELNQPLLQLFRIDFIWDTPNSNFILLYEKKDLPKIFQKKDLAVEMDYQMRTKSTKVCSQFHTNLLTTAFYLTSFHQMSLYLVFSLWRLGLEFSTNHRLCLATVNHSITFQPFTDMSGKEFVHWYAK